MGVLSRINDIVRSNLNDLVERAEHPEKQLKQAILDMEAQLTRARDGVVQTLAAEKLLEKKRQACQQTAERWERRAELALAHGDEDLARKALVRKNERDFKARQIDEQIQIQHEYVGALKHGLSLLEERLVDARMRKDALLTRAQAARARKKGGRVLAGAESHESSQATRASDTFTRMEDRVLTLEGQAEAFAEMATSNEQAPDGPSLEARFAELEQKDDLDAQLARLKASMADRKGRTR